MHFAKIHTSKRLQRVLMLLANGQEYSTRDIIRAVDVCAVNSIIAEIRANGIAVASRVQRGVWYYRIGGKTK